MSAIALPDHLRRFPCMQPWIGSRYRHPRHKRLLVVGESHYLPRSSGCFDEASACVNG